jgi:hypothetical protein
MSGSVEARHTLVRLLYQLISEPTYACIPICLGWRHSQNKGARYGLLKPSLAFQECPPFADISIAQAQVEWVTITCMQLTHPNTLLPGHYITRKP